MTPREAVRGCKARHLRAQVPAWSLVDAPAAPQSMTRLVGRPTANELSTFVLATNSAGGWNFSNRSWTSLSRCSGRTCGGSDTMSGISTVSARMRVRKAYVQIWATAQVLAPEGSDSSLAPAAVRGHLRVQGAGASGSTRRVRP